MKYFVSGLLLLALAVGLCAFTLGYENQHLGDVLLLLKRAADSMESDPSAALEVTEEAHRRWNKDAARFALMLTLEDVGELDRGFDNTLRALRRGAESGPDLLSDLCSLAAAMLKRDRLSWENLLFVSGGQLRRVPIGCVPIRAGMRCGWQTPQSVPSAPHRRAR